MLFVIYLKIEQAHSGFHKGDEANGFCQCPSFQVVLKPVNKLSTRGPFHARALINKTHCFCEANAINSFVLATLYKIIHRIFVLIWSIRYVLTLTIGILNFHMYNHLKPSYNFLDNLCTYPAATLSGLISALLVKRMRKRNRKRNLRHRVIVWFCV